MFRFVEIESILRSQDCVVGVSLTALDMPVEIHLGAWAEGLLSWLQNVLSSL